MINSSNFNLLHLIQQGQIQSPWVPWAPHLPPFLPSETPQGRHHYHQWRHHQTVLPRGPGLQGQFHVCMSPLHQSECSCRSDMHNWDHSFFLFSCMSRYEWYNQFYTYSLKGRSLEMPLIFQYFLRLPRLFPAFHVPSSIHNQLVLQERHMSMIMHSECNLYVSCMWKYMCIVHILVRMHVYVGCLVCVYMYVHVYTCIHKSLTW